MYTLGVLRENDENFDMSVEIKLEKNPDGSIGLVENREIDNEIKSEIIKIFSKYDVLEKISFTVR
jgi:putative AlgH/UPF0301 family transcriptional regulator